MLKPNKLISNNFIQTVAPVYLKHPTTKPSLDIEVELDADSKTFIHYYESKEPSQETILLIHGLTGCYQSNYMQRASYFLPREGYNVVLVNLRGSGPAVGFSSKPYHSGLSSDLDKIVKTFHQSFPDHFITLGGYSLGGNIVLKYLSEYDEPYIRGGYAVSPPSDLEQSVLKMQKTFFGAFSKYFTRSLISAFKENKYQTTTNINEAFKMNLYEFDDHFTAPIWGFESAADYYAKSSTYYRLKDIHKPCHILLAKDDPVVCHKKIESYSQHSDIIFDLVKHGGHVGFFERLNHKDKKWLDDYILNVIKDIRSHYA